MNTEHSQTELLTRYLLQDLQDAERDSLEEKYFTDNKLLNELLETENRLISDYLHGRLKSREKELFEQRYLRTPFGQQKFDLAYLAPQSEAAKSTINRMSSEGSQHTSWLKTILAKIGAFKPVVWVPTAGGLLIVTAIGLLALRQLPPKQIPRVAVPTVPSVNQGDLIASIELQPGADTRGIAVSNPTLRVGPKTRLIELKLRLVAPIYPKYQGQVLNKEEHMAKVDSDQSLIPQGEMNERFVLWKIEATVLPYGDYQIELRGMSASGETGDVSSYDLKVRDQ